MKEMKSASGQSTKRPKDKCSCGDGGEYAGTQEAGEGVCSCCCGPNETTDSVLTGAGNK